MLYRMIKLLPVALLALFLALFGGCRATPTRNESVPMLVVVDVFDPDGTLFDLENRARAFSFGTVARTPMVRVVVVTPTAIAGRKYLIALPAASAPVAGKIPPGLKTVGTKISFSMPAAFVANGPRQAIEFTDLKWPDPPAETSEVLRRN